MKKIKQVFPSRNYITIDSFGDVEVIFNPVGDGFEGDDKLMFRKGRWAFRVNDFLSGRIMPDGSKEGMGRKVYSLNLVYDDKDGEPIVNTTYVDPTSVIPLDGSIVDVVGSEKLAQEETLQTVAKEGTLQTVAKEGTLQTVAKEGTLQTVSDDLSSLLSSFNTRFNSRNGDLNSIGVNIRYSSGTVFYFGTDHFISLRSDSIIIPVGSEFLLLGDMSEYNNGVVKRLDGLKFAQSDVVKILS